MTGNVSAQTMYGRWLILPVLVLGSLAVVKALSNVAGELVNATGVPVFIWPLVGVLLLAACVWLWFWFMRRSE